jgi:hypothetical protein
MLPASGCPETPILTALSHAFHWQRLLDEGQGASGRETARWPAPDHGQRAAAPDLVGPGRGAGAARRQATPHAEPDPAEEQRGALVLGRSGPVVRAPGRLNRVRLRPGHLD